MPSIPTLPLSPNPVATDSPTEIGVKWIYYLFHLLVNLNAD
jgi:hypothetical protein